MKSFIIEKLVDKLLMLITKVFILHLLVVGVRFFGFFCFSWYAQSLKAKCMVFKLAPSKFKELSKLVDLNIRTVTVLTEIETVPDQCGAIFVKKTELEVMFEDFEKSLNR